MGPPYGLLAAMQRTTCPRNALRGTWPTPGTPTLLCPPAPCRRAEVTAPLPACRSVPEGTQARATFLAKAPGVLAGVWVAHAVFARVDPAVSLSWARSDGDRVQPGEILGEARGSAR